MDRSPQYEPSVDQFDAASTDDWPLTGIWSVTLLTDGVEPGTYTLEADDGDNTDTVTVQIVAAGEGGGEEPTTEEPAGNDTDTGDDTEEAPGNETDTGNNSSSIATPGPSPGELAN